MRSGAGIKNNEKEHIESYRNNTNILKTDHPEETKDNDKTNKAYVEPRAAIVLEVCVVVKGLSVFPYVCIVCFNIRSCFNFVPLLST